MAKPEPRDHQILVRIAVSEARMLDELVMQMNAHKSAVMREALRYFYAAKRKGKR